MKKFGIIFLIVATIAVGAIFVLGQKASGEKGKNGREGFGGKHHRRGGFGMFADKLDLTDAQKEQAKQIMETSRAKTQPIMESLRENHQKLEELSGSGNFDEAQVQALATEQGSLTALLVVEKERVKAQMFQLLTAEQRAQAEQLKAKMKERFKDGFQSPHGADENF